MKCCYKNGDLACQFEKDKNVNIHQIPETGEGWCEFHLPISFTTNGEILYTPKSRYSSEELTNFNDKIHRHIQEKNGKEQINLCGVVFPGNINFFSDSNLKNVEIKNLSLENTVFYGNTNFNDSHLMNHFSLNGAVFRNNVTFSNTIFDIDGNLIFRNIMFYSDVQFRECKFNSYRTIFSQLNFNKLDPKPICFISCDFQSTLKVYDFTFIGTVDFTGSTFKIIYIKNITFNWNVYFNNCNFTNAIRFIHVIFRMAPRFHDAQLHQDTAFLNVKFEDTQSESAPRAYQTLRVKMAEYSAREYQSLFYALEQRSIANQPNTSLTTKVAINLYCLFSDFGSSIGWPLYWLVLFTFCFSVFHYNIINNADLTLAFSFTIQQFIVPFSVWRSYPADIIMESTLFLLKITASLYSLLCIILIALLILAIRWRFRR